MPNFVRSLFAVIPRSIILLAVFFGILRLGLCFYFNPALSFNPDENRNYKIAQHHVEGNGYTILDGYNEYKGSQKPLPSAFHSSFTVFLYEFLIRHDVSKPAWVIFFNFVSALLLAFSILYFYKLNLFFLDGKPALVSTVIYCIFPSVIYFVGVLMRYENIAMPLIIIICYYMVKSIRSGISILEMCMVLFCMITSVFLRAQTLAIFIVLLTLYINVVIYQWKWRYLAFTAVIITCIGLMHLPVLKKNKEMFGADIISTQSGFELLQGNNPLARGSFRGNWFKTDNPYFQYVHKTIPGLDTMNEYQESEARKELAKKWVYENKSAFVKLCFRKLAIFFLPQNYEELPGYAIYNPINLFVYLFFFIGLGMRIFHRRINELDLILLSPIIGSLGLTLIYFMGSRWRYYAEPFMIVYAVMATVSLIEKYRDSTNVKIYGNKVT